MSTSNAHAHETPTPLGGRLVTPVTVTLGLLVAAMVAVLVVRFSQGLGATTNLSNGYPWGIWIAFDVVTGSALAGGGFSTALLVYILNRGKYHPMVRPALVAALFGYMQAGLSVMLDLGRWWDFWHIIWPRYAQVNSVLFEVAVCIMAYILVMMLELMPVVLERLGWRRARERVNRLLFIFIGLGVLLPMMHQSSMGSLLVVMGPQVHPLYQSMLLPLLFLSTTVGMGFAAVTIESGVSAAALKRPFEKEILAGLLQIGRALVAFFLVLRFGDLVYRGALGYAFQPSLPMAMFWIENVLMAVPLVLLATPEARRKQKLLFLSAMSLALGGAWYRISAFLVAYDTGAGWTYFPSLGELAVSLGLVAFEILAIVLAFRLLPILPAAQTEKMP